MWRAALARLRGLWRACITKWLPKLWTPPAVREVERVGMQQALEAMPSPPPAPNPRAGLDEADARLRYLEARRRLYGWRSGRDDAGASGDHAGAGAGAGAGTDDGEGEDGG